MKYFFKFIFILLFFYVIFTLASPYILGWFAFKVTDTMSAGFSAIISGLLVYATS